MNLKTVWIVILVAVLPFGLFAQEQANNSTLKGIWALKKTKHADGSIIDVPVGLFKLFDSDGTFSNVRVTPKGTILTHQGQFEIDGNDGYTETIQDQTRAAALKPMNTKQTHLKYKLSEDGNTLTIEGEILIDEGKFRFMLYEIWEKIKLYQDN